ncbi:MAG: diacylglycerol kinase family lipid kinase [Chlorobiaceae bacterium]|nr:diacylglycerol kinase family lipid kinase [Chlorobiaceae bacterium]
MVRKDSFTFIFNPAADKGRAAGKARMIERSLATFANASLEVSRFPGHAGEIARNAVGGSSTLIACGGDGTLNEVVNAVVGMPVRVGIIPVGSANDFLKTLRPAKKTTEDAIAGLADCASRTVDLGHVEFGDGGSRYFVNSIGIGFTGRIARTVQATPWFRGELSYAYALVSVLLGYTPLKMHIEIETPDGKLELREPVFAFSVSNGAVEGGKFRIAPHADPADGLLDVCILKAIPKWRFPGYVFKYLKGTQIDDPEVLYCKASALRVFMPEGDAMHMDGEVFRNVSGSMGISAVPRAVEILFDP